MKRTGLLILSTLTVFGCQRDDTKQIELLKDMNSGIQELVKLQKSQPAARAGANRPGPQRPQRPRPKPQSVYAVNIKGAPFSGAKDAKVTIVEAFEFA